MCAVLTVNYVVQDGKSNWLEGAILMILYVILAVIFWYYPGAFVCSVCSLFMLTTSYNQESMYREISFTRFATLDRN